ncbi:MAG TPA: methyltransferase domain-containing protein [Micropepsaceae bacterium]|nr:methyltransferase domain-containing protein [Micropepsaceae bacterium]
MHPDLSVFRQFYDSRLGTIARRLVRRRLRLIWPDVRGLRLAGIGYATPYLAPFVGEAACVIALMPAPQGAAVWPRQGPSRVALVHETDLPLDDGVLDRVVLVHGLETSEVWRTLLRQIWRVLKPDGRLLIVTPNRRSLWSASTRTPFGYGHPYSRAQLDRLVREAMFAPERFDEVLYGPPVNSALIMRHGRNWERIGRVVLRGSAGLLMVEATKAMVAPSGGLKVARARSRPQPAWARG